jgi:hypothetical protein
MYLLRHGYKRFQRLPFYHRYTVGNMTRSFFASALHLEPTVLPKRQAVISFSTGHSSRYTWFWLKWHSSTARAEHV